MPAKATAAVRPSDNRSLGTSTAFSQNGRAAAVPLAVRSRLPGDRFRPLGAPGVRKLQDVLVDRKVPRAARDRVPLLTAGGRLVWVAGHRIDHDFRLTLVSASALRVRILPLPTSPPPEAVQPAETHLSMDKGAP